MSLSNSGHDERLARRSPALLIIDPQVEATSSDGALSADHASAAVGNIVELLDAARSARLPVVFTQEVHRRELVDFGRELDGAEPIHCVEGTPGVELLPQTQPGDGEWLIQKRRYSAFFATDLDLLLRGLRVDTLIVCGFLTDVCVHYTCVDAHQRDYHLLVAGDGTAGSSAAAATAALQAVAYLQAGAVATTEEVIAAVQARRSPASAGPLADIEPGGLRRSQKEPAVPRPS
jgi:biuret amidohydrolase